MRMAGEETVTRATARALVFVVRLAVYTAVLIMVLDNMQVKITALITGLGIGGVAVALAAQNVLGDLFAALAIITDRPFVIGDFIVSGTALGTLAALGAKRSGIDFYVSATKLFLGQSLLVNGTLRATKANENGLLGFGATLGNPHNSYQLEPEVSVAYLLSKNVAIGGEYRLMPNNLEDAGRAAGLGDGLRSQDWKDLFVAWAPTKHLSITLAYVDLGVIVPATTNNRRQTGTYLSAQLAF